MFLYVYKNNGFEYEEVFSIISIYIYTYIHVYIYTFLWYCTINCELDKVPGMVCVVPTINKTYQTYLTPHKKYKR